MQLSPYTMCYPSKLENDTLKSSIGHLDGLLDRGKDKEKEKRCRKTKQL